MVDQMLELGIDHVAFNPGATFRGLHDSFVNHAGGRLRWVQCTHEEISVAVAHGFAKASGRPMAAAVHDVVGLQHASMAMFNAWCDRVPVLVLGGTGPMDATRRRPWIDWIHTANVQATLVRDYTKWDDQPASLAAVPESLARAVQLATTPPMAPVYVCLDADIQEQPAGDVQVLAAPPPPAPVAPDPEAVEVVARRLVAAARPVVVADRVGRSADAFQQLVELAELLALAVVDEGRGSLNFPSRHPLNLSGAADEVLAEADLVLGMESRDLFGVLHTTGGRERLPVRRVPLEAAVVNVSLEGFLVRSWTADHQRLARADVVVPCAPAAFLSALLPACRRLLAAGEDAQAAVVARRNALHDRSAVMRAGWERGASAAMGAAPVALPALAAALREALAGRDFVLANGTLEGWTHRLWDLATTDRFLGGSGGAGLGYGLGASIGCALASAPGRLVVDLQADGDALYTPSALWTLAHEKLSVLIVMFNNRAYQNSVEHAEHVARERRRPVQNRDLGNVLVDPTVDFAGLARSFGLHGEGPIQSCVELTEALGRALAAVESGRAALVDVVTEAR